MSPCEHSEDIPTRARHLYAGGQASAKTKYLGGKKGGGVTRETVDVRGFLWHTAWR